MENGNRQKCLGQRLGQADSKLPAIFTKFYLRSDFRRFVLGRGSGKAGGWQTFSDSAKSTWHHCGIGRR
jgi:hypothetical protein